MKRIQLFEFEDFAWFPTTFRSTMTKLIVVLHKVLGTKEVLGDLLQQTRSRLGFSRIVDIGSGSGGIMPEIVKEINRQSPDAQVELLLTDLHPNPQFIQSFKAAPHNDISYQAEPLDASNLSNAPEGLKTMVNSFHHMPPAIARKILATAQTNRQPFLIYEITENKIPTIVWVLLLPISLVVTALMAIFLLPAIRPFTFQDVLFTWLIPLVPIFYAWDGQASMPRMYTFEDFKQHLLPEESADYYWEMATAKKRNGKDLGYYVLGLPR